MRSFGSCMEENNLLKGFFKILEILWIIFGKEKIIINFRNIHNNWRRVSFLEFRIFEEKSLWKVAENEFSQYFTCFRLFFLKTVIFTRKSFKYNILKYQAL